MTDRDDQPMHQIGPMSDDERRAHGEQWIAHLRGVLDSVRPSTVTRRAAPLVRTPSETDYQPEAP